MIFKKMICKLKYIYNLTNLCRQERGDTSMKRIIFMETPEFSVPILQQLNQSQYEIVLVVTQPDRPKGRKKIITPPPVKVAAEKNNLPVFQPEKLTDDFQTIIDYQPDLIV